MRFPRCVLGLTRRVLGHTERVLGLTEGAAGVAEHEISDPSLTPHHTLPEFESKAWEEARRYKRPVLDCDTAEGGDSAVFVDEGRAEDLRTFPSKTGLLERGDEGVIVCDVDLGYERRGESTGNDWEHPLVAFAAATLVYRAHPAEDRYAT